MQCEYLVTGGAGFIGSNIVAELVRQEKRVRVLDNLSTGRAENLAGVRDRIEWIEGDIRDAATASRAVAGVRCVLHLGAMPSVIRSVSDPAASHDVNINGTLQMLLSSRDAGVQRFVFSSSSSVYGESEELPKHEEMPTVPLSPYALQKLAGEHYVRLFHELYGLGAWALRYFNVFGPRQDPASHYAAVIPKFATAALTGGTIVIYGDGGQTRDFTYVADVVAANLRCCDADVAPAGRVYNIARGERISVNALAERLMALAGRRVEVRRDPPRAGEVRDSEADPGRARRELGWRSAVTLDEGLARTVAWYRGAGAAS